MNGQIKVYKINKKPKFKSKVKFDPGYFNRNLRRIRKQVLSGKGLVSG
jgi:hypothetical protein